MSNLPRNARIQALHDIGTKIDDGLEQAKIQTARREGARTAHTEAANQLIGSLKDQSLDKNTVMHCVKVLQQMITTSSALYFTALGAEKQCEAHVAIIKNMYDLEVALKTREEILPSPEELAVPRPAPLRTLKEMRLAEAATAAEEKSEEAKDSPPEVIKDTGIVAQVIESPIKKLPRDNKKKNLVKVPPSDEIDIVVDTSGLEDEKPIKSPKKSREAKKKR